MNERAVLYLLLFGCAAFGAAIFAELAAAPDNPPGTAPVFHHAAPPAASPAPRVPRLAQLVATTLARPLFSPTRRPPPEKGGGPGGAGLADMRLTGIVTEPGERLAIFAVTGAKPLIVREGEEVSGWRIEGITPGAVSLSGPNGTETLQPKPDSSLVRTTAATVTTPTPEARFFGPAGRARGRFFRPAARPGFRPPARPLPAGSQE
ncbi:MAG TPA: hypothetical protein VE993_00360 [Stellaceae bacterium]|nr:hypothetical protein [Stellaceae bacterium]